MVTCAAVFAISGTSVTAVAPEPINDHALAGVVEIPRPFLRMHDLAGEVGRAGKFRRVAFLVFVIARAHEQEIAGEADDFGRALAHRALGLHRPARLRRRPRRAFDAVVEADLPVDAVVDSGLADVIQNPRPVGDRLRLGPRFERIAERIHVRVGADAGIAKQIPGAADAVAPLEDHVALARAFLLQVIARANAGQAGADNEDVEMFCCLGHGDLPAARSNGLQVEIATRIVGLPQRYRLYRNLLLNCGLSVAKAPKSTSVPDCATDQQKAPDRSGAC